VVTGDGATGSEVVLPAPCLVVLVGPSGSGKSTWAAAHFAPVQIVSSDALRAVVGAGEDDITASEDAFALLEQIVERRTQRGLTTVVDTLGLDPDRRRAWAARAHQNAMPCVCVAFATPLAECRARNRERRKSVPQKVLAGRPGNFGSSSRSSPTTASTSC
jgi:predicted kinase